MKVTVCIGSSCHIKGSRQVVEQLQYLIAQNGLKDKVELGGTFCMGKCQQGVCVTVDDAFFSLTPDTTKEFFEKEILAQVYGYGYNTDLCRQFLSPQRLARDSRVVAQRDCSTKSRRRHRSHGQFLLRQMQQSGRDCGCRRRYISRYYR